MTLTTSTSTVLKKRRLLSACDRPSEKKISWKTAGTIAAALILTLGLGVSSCWTDQIAASTVFDLEHFSGISLKVENPPSTSGGGPFVLLAGQCVASTVTQAFIRELLQRHGIQPYRTKFEIIKKIETNTVYQRLEKILIANNETVDYETVMLQSIKEMHLEANKLTNTKLVFKAQTQLLSKHLLLFEGLREMGARFTMIYRENHLDHCICQVRDCLKKKFGYPVFAKNGTRTNLCFGRRAISGVTTKAYMERPVECIVHSQRQIDLDRAFFASAIPPPTRAMIPTEALFGFEYTSDATVFDESVRVWLDLLKPFLRDFMNETIVRQFLDEHQNTRKPPGPHQDVVYNPSFVVKQLRRSNVTSFLRLD